MSLCIKNMNMANRFLLFVLVSFSLIKVDAQVHAVDLGLSVKWGSCNLGADSPLGYGDCYAWGETTVKSTIEWENYKWANVSNASATKYNQYDNRIQLERKDDAASVALGGGWRIPTVDEWKELWRKCDCTWVEQYGVKGLKFRSKINGNSIFLPAAGFKTKSSRGGINSGYYYTSERSPGYENSAPIFWFCKDGQKMSSETRYVGCSIRPVKP
jgi:uncharacterized protein (TIGR02145 family)